MLCGVNNKSFVYAQLNDQKVLFQTIQFIISHLFALSLNVKHFLLLSRDAVSGLALFECKLSKVDTHCMHSPKLSTMNRMWHKVNFTQHPAALNSELSFSMTCYLIKVKELNCSNINPWQAIEEMDSCFSRGH